MSKAHTRRRRLSRLRQARPQFHCSNELGLCDRCGHLIERHLTGDYYCPAPRRKAELQ